jgi:hypothetical protein
MGLQTVFREGFNGKLAYEVAIIHELLTAFHVVLGVQSTQ